MKYVIAFLIMCTPVFGDVYFTRNAGSDKTTNRTPGYWNHCAVDALPAPDGTPRIAEMQSGVGLILVDKYEFLARYPIIDVIHNGLVYTGEAGENGKYRFILNNCTTFVSKMDPDTLVRIRPDAYRRALKRKAKR